MLLYRIVPEIYVDNCTGKGASFMDGARWNKSGVPVLYFAFSPSVAMLEMANYFPSPRLIPKNRVLGIYSLPDDIAYSELTVSELANDWAAYPYTNSTQEAGLEWLLGNNELMLKVPSVSTPAALESIAVINPTHEEIKKLKIKDIKKDIFNERSFTGI